jgi:hypothetical protein
VNALSLLFLKLAAHILENRQGGKRSVKISEKESIGAPALVTLVFLHEHVDILPSII